MSSTNQSPEYKKAQEKYLQAETLQEKIIALEEMIRECPKHKSSEKMLSNLKTRYKKLKQDLVKAKKSGKSTSIGIKKENHQIIIIGKTNSGKSTLISKLTNKEIKTSPIQFTTISPIIRMKNIETINMQLIENPAIESEYYDKGLTNSADALIIIINNIQEIKEIYKHLERATKKRIIIYNPKNELNKNELRKISETLKSKKYNYLILNCENPEKDNLHELENKIFQTFDKIRVYTKEPEKKQKTSKPIILNQESIVKDAAEKILKGFSQKIKQTKIWGPSSKFPGQIIGLNHKLKDLDIVEFKTK
ncbi:MAG: GTPase [Nanoarchaeota archaeon]